MSTLREQIDALSPEEYAREAQAIARDAIRRAKDLGMEDTIPQYIYDLLDVSEEELARQRRNAIEHARSNKSI